MKSRIFSANSNRSTFINHISPLTFLRFENFLSMKRRIDIFLLDALTEIIFDNRTILFSCKSPSHVFTTYSHPMKYRTISDKYIFFTTLFTLLSINQLNAQHIPKAASRLYEAEAQRIITVGLSSYHAYEMLAELCTKIGARLSGSPQAEQAVEWVEKKMKELGFENVRLEKVMVPHWVRGPVEEAYLISSSKKKSPLRICALGGSISTPKNGITAEVVEVKSFDELKNLGEKAKDKIIFFNRPMDRTKTSWGEAYGGAVNQRSVGAIEAAKAGGVLALVRSMTMRIDTFPHTGAMNYHDSIPKIPSTAISTQDADMLSAMLKKDKSVKVFVRLSCQMLPDVESANVIGEIVGSEKPDEVIVIGGHLDSWDKGQGAHDDGAGCMQSIEALRLMKEIGLRPRRTIRCVLFMNEENGLRGGKAYAEKKRPGEKHIAAIETDAGGFSPRGFGIQADSLTVEKIARWSYLLQSIDADKITQGGGGADISPLTAQGVVTIGMHVEGNKYFDYHHSALDTIDKVHERELELGAISLAIFSYTLAEEGL